MNIKNNHIVITSSGIEKEVDLNTLYVNIIGNEEGRYNIIQVVRETARNIELGKVKFSDVNSNFIQKNLTAMKNLPDPDLLIVFSASQVMNGFPPWNLRSSEIIFIDKLKGMNIDNFLCLLDTFANTVQRNGI